MELYKAAQYAEAAEEFKVVIQLQPDHPAGYYMLALCQVQLKQWDEAQKNFQKVMELQPDHFESYYQYSLIAAQKEQYREVVDTITRGLVHAKKPFDRGKALKLRGGAYFQMGQLEAAAEDLNEAMELLPKDSGVVYLLGLIVLRQKQFERAYELLDRAYQMKPERLDYARHLLEAATATRRYERALEVGEILLQRGVRNPTVLLSLGIAYLALRQYEPAANVFALLPDTHPLKLYNLAQAYIGQKKWNEAERLLLRWKENAPNHPKVYELLGYVYENLQRPKDALTHYQKAFELTKDDRYQEMIKRAQQAIERAQKKEQANGLKKP